MIQRPQTLFLLASAVLVIMTFFFPFWETTGPEIFKLNVIQFFKIENGQREIIRTFYHILPMGIIAAGVTFFTIFKYNNRPLQLKLCSISSLLIGAYIMVIVFWLIPDAQKAIGALPSRHHWSFYLPAGSVLCNFVAKLLIRRDENLVKSVDRLR